MRSSRASTRQGRRRCSCRCRPIPTSRRRRSRRPATSCPRATARRSSRRRCWDGYFADAGDRPVHLEATPVVLLRRRTRRRGAARPPREPARAARVPRTGEPGDLVLHLPEGAAAVPRRLPDRGLPGRGRPPRPRRLPRPREREVHGVPRRLLRRLPAGVDRHARHRAGARRSTSSAWSTTRPTTLRTTATALGLDPSRSRPMPSAPRTAPPASRASRSSGSRWPATTGWRRCSAAIPTPSASSGRSTTGSTARRAEEPISAAVRAELTARYEEPNARLVDQLDAAGIRAPRVAHRRRVRSDQLRNRRVLRVVERGRARATRAVPRADR